MHSLINGGVGNNPTNQNLTYGQGYSGKCEELKVYTGIQGVQRVTPLIRNPNNNQGYFREYEISAGAGTNMGVQGASPLTH